MGHHITGATLKRVACFTMFIDHFFAVLFLGYLNLHPVNGGRDPQLYQIYRVGRAVGRVSFVLFAYLIVEGFLHTKSRTRYLLRLGLFALLSEIPFDLAFSGEIVDPSGQNIYWTLFLGVLVLTLWEKLERYHGFFGGAARVLLLFAGCSTALVFSTDYRYMGVLLIFVLYQTHDHSAAAQILAAGCVMLLGTWSANCIRYAGQYSVRYLLQFSTREMYGLFAFLLIVFYNGERGRQLPKFFYYGFYPVHLLFLYGIARATGIM